MIQDILTKFMIIKNTEETILVLRPYQIHSVKLAMNRVLIENSNGYCFGATGCGKTITSYKLAMLLKCSKNISRVFLLVDRKDLDDQLVDEYNSFEPNCVDHTDDSKTLVKMLHDSNKKLIITTIQKMANVLRNPKYEQLLEKQKNAKCVFIIDECHRSQFGKMHSAIRKCFNNSNFIGFTGTPIFKENKGSSTKTTADIFYSGHLNPCIHKYLLSEAIADGVVLRFSVEFKRSVPIGEVHDINPEENIDDETYCARHHISIDDFYHSPKRIAYISNDILESINRYTQPNNHDIYTSIFATDSVKSCFEYYNYMKTHNENHKRIAAIFTYQSNEKLSNSDDYSFRYLETCISDYNEMFGTAFDLNSFDAYRKDISNRLKQKTFPQIDLLIVVNMFLTGFDSKVTNTLYLDKSLSWHSLLQAYSRTNRVYKLSKPFGHIISYRNIKKEQDDALRLFSGNSDDKYLFASYDEFIDVYDMQVGELKNIVPSANELSTLIDETKQKQFISCFTNLSRTLRILKTFEQFDWNDINLYMDEYTFMEYKSWFLSFCCMYLPISCYRSPISSDIDFYIETVFKDEINVSYINTLIDEVKKQNSITDNSINHFKVKEIIDKVLSNQKKSEPHSYKKSDFATDNNYIIDSSIKMFASENHIDAKVIRNLLNIFIQNKSRMSKELIRNSISSFGLNLIKTTRLTESISLFLQEMYNLIEAV